MVKHIAAGVGMLVGLWALVNDLRARPTKDWGAGFVFRMTGYDINSGNWNIQNATAGLPMAAGVGVSYVAAKTGVNRYTPKGINL